MLNYPRPGVVIFCIQVKPCQMRFWHDLKIKISHPEPSIGLGFHRPHPTHSHPEPSIRSGYRAEGSKSLQDDGTGGLVRLPPMLTIDQSWFSIDSHPAPISHRRLGFDRLPPHPNPTHSHPEPSIRSGFRARVAWFDLCTDIIIPIFLGGSVGISI